MGAMVPIRLFTTPTHGLGQGTVPQSYSNIGTAIQSFASSLSGTDWMVLIGSGVALLTLFQSGIKARATYKKHKGTLGELGGGFLPILLVLGGIGAVWYFTSQQQAQQQAQIASGG